MGMPQRWERVRARSTARSLLAVAVWAAGSAGTFPGTAAAQELAGRVLLTDSLPVPGAMVELHRITEEAGALVDSALSDPGGRFSFQLPTGEEPGDVFLVGARYGGLLYWGSAVHAGASAELEDYSVTVFDTALVAEPVTALRTGIRHVVLTPSAAGIQVEEMIDVEGVGDRALVGASDSSLVWATSLARDAHGVMPAQGGVPAQNLAIGQGSVGFAGALPPSGIRVAVRYVIPASEYVLRLDHPTGRMEVLVMPQPGMDVEVAGLSEAPVGEGMRVPVRRFAGTDLAEMTTVSVRAVVEEGTPGTAWIWFVVSLVLGAAALFSVRFVSSRS